MPGGCNTTQPRYGKGAYLIHGGSDLRDLRLKLGLRGSVAGLSDGCAQLAQLLTHRPRLVFDAIGNEIPEVERQRQDVVVLLLDALHDHIEHLPDNGVGPGGRE